MLINNHAALALHWNARINKGPKCVRRLLLKRADNKSPHMLLLGRHLLSINRLLQSRHLQTQTKKKTNMKIQQKKMKNHNRPGTKINQSIDQSINRYGVSILHNRFASFPLYLTSAFFSLSTCWAIIKGQGKKYKSVNKIPSEKKIEWASDDEWKLCQ